MNKRKLTNVQRDIIEDNCKYVVGNFSRNSGKDIAIVAKIIKDKPLRCIIDTLNFKYFANNLKRICEEFFEGEVGFITISMKTIEICFNDGNHTFIERCSNRDIDIYCRMNKCYDLAIFNDRKFRYGIESKQYLCMFTSCNINKFIDNDIIKQCNIHTYGLKNMLKDKLITKEQIEDDKRRIDYDSFKYEIDILDEYDSIFVKELTLIEKIDKEIDDMMSKIGLYNLDNKIKCVRYIKELVVIRKMYNESL